MLEDSFMIFVMRISFFTYRFYYLSSLKLNRAIVLCCRIAFL